MEGDQNLTQPHLFEPFFDEIGGNEEIIEEGIVAASSPLRSDSSLTSSSASSNVANRRKTSASMCTHEPTTHFTKTGIEKSIKAKK